MRQNKVLLRLYPALLFIAKTDYQLFYFFLFYEMFHKNGSGQNLRHIRPEVSQKDKSIENSEGVREKSQAKETER